MKAILTIGLPASGKTTWAKAEAARTGAIRINNDDIRNAIYRGLGHRTWSKAIEKAVRAKREALITEAAYNGKDIILDNTHCNSYVFKETKSFCETLGYTVDVQDFRHVSVDECIRRDSLREGIEQVGEDVIRGMAKKIKSHSSNDKFLPDAQNTGKPRCIIVDIDGTLAKRTTGRSPYDESRVYEDGVRYFVLDTVIALQLTYNYNVIVFSGRTDACQNDTVEWLENKCGVEVITEFNKEEIQNDKWFLAMRSQGDRRVDSIIKTELYEKYVKDNYDVFAVFDDRAQVIRDGWAKLGLPVFRCGLIDKDDF